ncbi:hypothetical protein DFH08DRAFT_1002249 [Mycena albidolilacea]|uniref:F-box domain-containing protein n=1 Tax=Mycena albidolilacea TaxID=1033008 RepID=A0AAD7A123_9AGAR|nr:hypothetical protein DFH08DRAFT_1002249 [Mycena albidolilacea]
MEQTITAVPVELWDLIFHHLDGDSLLTFAVVCRGFNELAIIMYLLRQGVSAISIKAGNLDISCDGLSALQLSCPLLPLKRLRCTFSGSRLSWKLGLLQNIISQTPSMQELHLELPEEFTSYGAHAALHGVLYAACSKVQGPVLVVYGGELLKYTLPQISASIGPALAPRWLHPFSGVSRRVETGAPRFSSVHIRMMFSYGHHPTSSVVMLKSILRRIATHFAPFLRLCLCIKGRNTRTLNSARTMFPFPARLPALRHLDFWLMMEGAFLGVRIVEFVVEAKAELPGVGEIKSGFKLARGIHRNFATSFALSTYIIRGAQSKTSLDAFYAESSGNLCPVPDLMEYIREVWDSASHQ